ncbi:hypothetical protein [Marinomonas posidonica]|uniref:hypothetical protein n=1 Tax=Marinomonas TaxID=28253 RepID=UPI003735D1B8
MSGIPGISSGGGDISPDLSATATNTGGTNSLGGFSFGNYNASTNYTPYIIGAVVLGVLWYLLKGKKRR